MESKCVKVISACVCRLDSSRDDIRVRADVLQREVADLQLRNEELTSLAQEAQSLKDEMDVLRSVMHRFKID